MIIGIIVRYLCNFCSVLCFLYFIKIIDVVIWKFFSFYDDELKLYIRLIFLIIIILYFYLIEKISSGSMFLW